MFKIDFEPQSNRATWAVPVSIRDEETGEPIDLAGCDICVSVTRDQDRGYHILKADIDDGGVTVLETGVFLFQFSDERMRCLSEGTYRVGCRISRDGETAQLWLGVVPIVEGI